jgi:putative transposase
MSNSKKRARRQYTTKEREAAVASAKAIGASAAADEHGIPMKTVWNWVRRARNGASANSDDATPNDGDPRPAGHNTTAGGNGGRPAPAKPAPTKPESPTPSTKRKPQRRYTPSEKAEILEQACVHGPTAASKEFGVSRYSISEWRRQERRAAEGKGLSPTSGPAPQDVAEQRDREILTEWHKHPGLGPSQVRNQLRRRGVKVAVQTVRRVMEEDGYRPPKVKATAHDQRFEAVRPNHLWHLDFVQRYVNRASVFTLILLDDCSRFVVGHGVDDAERADLVRETFEKAVERHGKPERVIHDKGSAFWSWRGISRFTALLTELGIDQVVAEHKQWNGKLEAFNGNLHTELFDVVRFYDVGDMKRRLSSHLDFYNHRRTHHALGGLLVPADRYYGRHEEVLARIEAGVPADAAHEALDLGTRSLELFKVTSSGGSPQVWLMGQRLLSGAK